VLDCHLSGIKQRVGAESEARTNLPPGFEERVVVSGLTTPTSFALLGDGRILIAEKPGLVRLYKDGELLPRPFLDLRRQVRDDSLRGLLAIERDPAFSDNGFVYLLYVYDHLLGAGEGPHDYKDVHRAPEGAATVRVSRFRAVRDAALLTSERVLVGAEAGGICDRNTSDCIPAEGEHTGGDIEFTRDGNMLISTGDGSLAQPPSPRNKRRSLRAQALDSLAGKLLRVDRRGNGLPNNPFWTGDARANRSRVWAYGLRNPFRFTLRENGAAVIGDVGWNTTEEINVGGAGANFGWPCYEGREPRSEYAGFVACRSLRRRSAQLVAPHYSYATGARPERASVTGGVVYEGSAYPEEYRGAYFFGDWSRNELRHVRLNTTEAQTAREFARNAAGPAQLAIAPSGNLLYLAINSGEIREVVYAR
jgi:glucose/arabinose dehydrogenase